MNTVYSNKLKKYLKISVMSEKEAVWYSKKATQSYQMISITSKGEATADIKESGYLKGILRLQFNDIESDINGVKAPVKEDFIGLKEFIDSWNTGILIVHCGAGVSRSAGVMAAILEYLQVTDYDIFNDKRHIPNRLVYRLASQELGIGKGNEYFENVFKEEE